MFFRILSNIKLWYRRSWLRWTLKKIYMRLDYRPFIYTTKCKKRNTKTLRARFRELGVPFNFYCFTGGKPNNTLVMKRFLLIFYCCYFSERGVNFDKRVFFTSSQACRYYFCEIVTCYEDEYKTILPLTDDEREEIKDFDRDAWGFDGKMKPRKP